MTMVYLQPGVYTQEKVSAEFLQLPPGTRIPAIVGTGDTTAPIANISVVKGATNGLDLIVSPSLQTISSISAVGTVPDLGEFVRGTDYQLTSNQVDWSLAGSQPTYGSTYYVSYRRTKTDAEYAPTAYFTLADIRSSYGGEFNNGVMSPITVMANLLFANGAPQEVIVCQSKSGSNSDMQDALDQLKGVDIDCVIMAEATNSTLQNYLRNHVIVQSSSYNRHERVTYGGFTTGLSASVSDQIALGQAIKTEGMMLFSPPNITATFKDVSTQQDVSVMLPSSYVSAAEAGLDTNPAFTASEPKTRKTHVGYTIGNFNYLPSQMDLLAGTGNITVLVSNAGVIQIRDARTTDPTTINTLMPSVVLAKHSFVKGLRKLLDGQYIGTKIDNSTASSISATISAYCNQQINASEIRSFRNILVKQDTINPTQMNVSLEIQAIYPLQYIQVQFSFFVA